MALKERPTALVIVPRVFAQREVDRLSSRKLARFVEYPRAAVYFGCGLKKQVLQRRVQVLTYNQSGSSRDQRDVLVRPVSREVHNSARQDKLAQIRSQRHLGIGTLPVEHA